MAALLLPESEEALAHHVRDHARGRKPLAILGGGTRPVGNPVTSAQRVSTAGMTGISVYEPGALTLVARAGTPLEDVVAALGAECQHLPFEAPDWRSLLGTEGTSTLGGMVASGYSGPRRLQVGAVRDSLIGVRFVSGEGEIVKNGGRVMKNVTGYDLVKLLCGSHGTLGILTELSFKLLPRPETAACVLVNGLDDATAIRALAAALGSPFDVSAAAHAPGGVDGHPVTMIRVEGLEKSVAYRAERLRELVSGMVPEAAGIAIERDPAKVAAGWKWIRDVEAFHGREGAVWRLSVKPSDGPAIVSGLKATMDAEVVYDWGGGLVWLLVDDGGDAQAADIRKAVAARGGHATLFRAPAQTLARTDAFHPEPEPVARISEGLRRQFDPHGIFNPGRMARQPGKAAA